MYYQQEAEIMAFGMTLDQAVAQMFAQQMESVRAMLDGPKADADAPRPAVEIIVIEEDDGSTPDRAIEIL